MTRLLSLAVALGLASVSAPAGDIRFEDVAREAGVAFAFQNAPTSRKHLIETMPGGMAVFDFDGDGRLDLFFANGAPIPSLVKDSPRYWNRLFRNEGGMKFSDRTEAAGLRGEGYASSVAVADYKRMRRFYTNTLGFVLYREVGTSACCLALDDQLLLYLEGTDDRTRQLWRRTRPYFLLPARTVRELYERLKAARIACTLDTLSWRLDFVFEDPTGNRIRAVSDR